MNIKALAEQIAKEIGNPHGQRMYTNTEKELATALLRVWEDGENLAYCLRFSGNNSSLKKRHLESHNKLMEELGGE